jgi:hypothetical protein
MADQDNGSAMPSKLSELIEARLLKGLITYGQDFV